MSCARRFPSALSLLFTICLACGPADDAPSGSTMGSGSTGTSGSGETSASETQSTTGSGSSTSSTTGNATSSTTDSSGSESGSSETGAIDCDARCAEQGACGELVEENCLSNCVETQRAADAVGEACAEAYVGFQDCQTQRTCDQIEQGTGCEAEVAIVMEACGQLAPAACEAVCPKWIECGLLDREICLGTCALEIGFARVIGSDCAAAYESVFSCEAELECSELDVEHCVEEVAASGEACE